jgi:YHS domain-containing protein
MFRRILLIILLVLIGSSTAAVVKAGMHSQQNGMGGMRGSGSCMGGMMGMGAIEGSRGRKGVADTSREDLMEPLTEGRKKVGEQFTCPVDGRRMTVTEYTPATEYRGTIYYFCTQPDKEAFLKDPERYAKKDVSRIRGEK